MAFSIGSVQEAVLTVRSQKRSTVRLVGWLMLVMLTPAAAFGQNVALSADHDLAVAVRRVVLVWRQEPENADRMRLAIQNVSALLRGEQVTENMRRRPPLALPVPPVERLPVGRKELAATIERLSAMYQRPQENRQEIAVIIQSISPRR